MNTQNVTSIIIAGCALFGLMGAFFTFVTTAIVRAEIKKLNGTYLYTKLAEVRFNALEEKVAWLRGKHS